MKWENIKKSEKKIIIISVIAVLLTLIVGVSYAYIAYYTKQEGINVLESDCINVEMEELTNALNLKNAYPVTDEVGAHSKPFRFKLTNTCGVGVNYNINLEVMETEKRIASNNIAVKVDESEKSILSDNAVATPIYKESDYTGVESYTVGKGELKPYDNVIHDVRIWLDESAGNDTQNGTFYSKVIIEAIQNQKTAISLVDYLIDESYIDDAIEEFSHEATYQTPALTDYRYTGANPNNYVYFGCEGESCTEENLYRIIGVIPTQSEVNGEYINRVKLIKATAYTENESGYLKPSVSTEGVYLPGINDKGYEWNSANWDNVTINKNVLNGYYWNSLGEFREYITSSIWYLGALKLNNRQVYTSEQFYIGERSNTQVYGGGILSYIGNIGLMYASDYGYSLGNNYKSESIYTNRNLYTSNSWLYILENTYFEWTITSESTMGYNRGWEISRDGSIYQHSNTNNFVWSIRPTFYLKEDILYKSGNGSIENPYRIGLNE